MSQRRIGQARDGTNNFSRDLVQSMNEAVAYAEGKKTGARVHVIEGETCGTRSWKTRLKSGNVGN
jgi:hypothetical protein